MTFLSTVKMRRKGKQEAEARADQDKDALIERMRVDRISMQDELQRSQSIIETLKEDKALLVKSMKELMAAGAGKRRKKRTAQQRIAICETHGWICHISGGLIDPTRDKWQLDHIIPLALGGDDEDSNLAPALSWAHQDKTKDDVRDIAKSKRVQARNMGARRHRGRPMPGSKDSDWKHKLNGDWEKRD